MLLSPHLVFLVLIYQMTFGFPLSKILMRLIEGKWKEIDSDCLLNVFGRVAIGVVAFGNPFCMQVLVHKKSLS